MPTSRHGTGTPKAPARDGRAGAFGVCGRVGPRGQDLETIRTMPYATAAAHAAKQT